jgi:hypothetical protein
VGIYYQGVEFSGLATKITERLRQEGLQVTVEANSLRQLPSWSNTVRCFRDQDAPLALKVRDILRGLDPALTSLRAIDLSREFKGWRMRQGALEIWLCDAAKNGKLAPQAYEKKFSGLKPAFLEPGGYFEGQSLDAKVGGSHLRILRDLRLLGKDDWSGLQVNPESSGVEDEGRPFLNSILSLVDQNGAEVDQMKLDAPLASISVASLDIGRPVFKLQIDHLRDFGIDVGWAASMIIVESGKLKVAESVDMDGKKREGIWLLNSGKAAWRVTDKTTILALGCRAVAADTQHNFESEVVYLRYSWEKDHWVRRERSKPGFWEQEDQASFPDRSLFP